MILTIYAVFLSVWIVSMTSAANTTIESHSYNINNDTVSKVLSRRKRFLIFPDGSSVQLVFCNQNHGYLQIANIVWIAHTAAIAWELPTDPEVYDMFRDRSKLYEANRKSDVIYYLNEEGKVIDKAEYKRKIIVNPAFAKRSVDTIAKKNTITTKLIKKMHNIQKNKNRLKELDARRKDLYRKETQKLYAKLENFLQALGWNGKDCILKLLCQTGRANNAQGTFFEEILRVFFTLPKVHVVPEVHNQYDDAHGANGDCAQLYPNCGPTGPLQYDQM